MTDVITNPGTSTPSQTQSTPTTPTFTVGQNVVIIEGVSKGRRIKITKIDNQEIYGKVQKGGINALTIGPLEPNQIKAI